MDDDLTRALGVLRLTNAERYQRVTAGDAEVYWFLERVDELAPELVRRGWAHYAPFTECPGEVVTTDESGEIVSLRPLPVIVS